MNRTANVYFDNCKCGELKEFDDHFEFIYDSSFLESPNAQPISLLLPLQKEPYSSPTLFPFFDGLIPEGWLLDLITQKWKIDYTDRMGLLLLTGKDTIGAVSVEEVQ